MCFKFQQNRTINEQFDFLMGGRGKQGVPRGQRLPAFLIPLVLLVTVWKCWFLKFNLNRKLYEEFDFWRGKILLGGPEGGRGTRYQKFEKALYRTEHRKLQHSSSIRKSSKNQGNWFDFFFLGGGGSISRIRKKVPYTPKISVLENLFAYDLSPGDVITDLKWCAKITAFYVQYTFFLSLAALLQ